MVAVRYVGKGSRGNDRIAVGVSALVFLATVTCAAVVLPDRVHLYYTPTDRPDVVYELWQYLMLLGIGGGIIAVAFGAVASAFAATLMTIGVGPSGAEPRVASWVSAWTLLWLSAEVWLVIWLGNDQPVTRSWLEVLVALSGLTGTVFVVVWGAWVVARRGRADKQATPRRG